jgi:hypothetical protein
MLSTGKCLGTKVLIDKLTTCKTFDYLNNYRYQRNQVKLASFMNNSEVEELGMVVQTKFRNFYTNFQRTSAVFLVYISTLENCC